MGYLEKHPMIMIVVGVIGISLSSIFVRFSTAPSAVTAAWRLLWTVILMTPVVLGKASVRRELAQVPRRLALLSLLSGVFLALHFVTWFESLKHTTVAGSTTIVCTEVIWVSLGYCLFLKGRLSGKAMAAIAVTVLGSVLIAWSDSGQGSRLYGDLLALIAAVAVAVYTLLGRVVRSRVSTIRVYLSGLYRLRRRSGDCLFCRRIQSDRFRPQRPGRGSAAGGFFHHSGTQHFLLVPEIFLPGLCFRLQTL